MKLLSVWMVLAAVCLAAPPDLAIVDASRAPQMVDDVIRQLRDKRVVFIGEEHDRYDQHLSQLEMIRRLDMASPGHWVIGVEYFQRAFQPYLDAYIAGSISEREFLVKTEYFERWGYDYRLYRPIFTYARERHIPLVALNAEHELVDKVDDLGLAGLSPSDRARLPQQIEEPDASYRERLHKAFEEHPGSDSADFDRFVQVQSVWDETMAETAAQYLSSHPDNAMIVLAGSGHIAFGSGIPARLKRRWPNADIGILMPGDKASDDLQGAEYMLVSSEFPLPPSGKMGITMKKEATGVVIKSVSPDGTAAKAGLHIGDVIVAIDGQAVRSLGDVRLATLDKEPGQRISLRAERQTASGPQAIAVDATLQN